MTSVQLTADPGQTEELNKSPGTEAFVLVDNVTLEEAGRLTPNPRHDPN